MKISVTKATKVKVSFEGKLNMSQEIILRSSDAQKLGEMLISKKSGSFKTK